MWRGERAPPTGGGWGGWVVVGGSLARPLQNMYIFLQKIENSDLSEGENSRILFHKKYSTIYVIADGNLTGYRQDAFGMWMGHQTSWLKNLIDFSKSKN